MNSALTLEYDTPVILIGGGHVVSEHLSSLVARGYPLIAADGAANQFLGTGIVPHAIVGDLDSLDDIEHWRTRTRVIAVDEQESTDFEKCLYSTSAPLYFGLGLLGRRFDHSLAAMHVLAKYATEKRVILVDETDLVFAASGSLNLELAAGERVSVFPLASVTFKKSTGLKYPLDDLTLEQGRAIGTSNEAIGGTVEIICAQGGEAPYMVVLGNENLAAVEQIFQIV